MNYIFFIAVGLFLGFVIAKYINSKKKEVKREPKKGGGGSWSEGTEPKEEDNGKIKTNQ